MIGAYNLTVAFGAAQALRDVSFEVHPGDRIGVVGESGCGKTMLGLAMIGMTPDAAKVSGSLLLNGTEMVGASAH